MSTYKAQAEISLADKASGPFQRMVSKIRGAAQKMSKGVGGVFTSMRNKVSGLIKSMGRSITTFLPLLTVAGLGYGFISATKEAAGFSKQMAKVSTMLSGPAMLSMDSYADAIKKMAVKFGRSTEEISNGLYNVLSAAVPASDAVAFLDNAVKAAMGGFAQTDDVVRSMAAMMKSYGLEAKDAGDITDWLLTIQKRGITTVGEFAPLLGTIAGSAKSAGITMDELGGIIASMTGKGVPAAIAMTRLRAGITALNSSAGETSEVMGIFRDALHKGGFAGLINVIKSMNLSVSQLGELFPNVRAKEFFETMVTGIGRLEEDIGGMKTRLGEANAAAGKMLSSAYMKLASAKQELIAIKRTVGEALMPGLLEALRVVSLLLKTDWIQRALKSIGKTIGSIISNIFKIMGAIGLGIERYGSFLDFVANSTDATWDYINSKILELGIVVLQIVKATVGTAISVVVGAIGTVMELVGAAIKSVLPTGFGWIGSAISAGGKAITGAASSLAKEINGLIDTAVGFWTDKAKGLKDKALASGDDFIKQLEGKADEAINRVAGKTKKDAERAPKWMKKFTTTPTELPFGTEGQGWDGKIKQREQLAALRKLMGGGRPEEMAMGQLAGAQTLGQFGISYGGLVAGRAARFVRKFGAEEGMKRYQEQVQREQRIAPGVGFFEDMTPAARERMRQQAIQSQMIAQRPEEFAQKVTAKMSGLQKQLTESILSGNQKRTNLLQKEIGRLGAAREQVTPQIQSQLDHLKQVRDAIKKSGKTVPKEITEKIGKLEGALGKQAKEEAAKKTKEKEKDADMLKTKAEMAVKKHVPAVKGFVKAEVVQPIIDAMKNNKAEANASVSVNCQGDCQVERQQSTSQNQPGVPRTYPEPVSSPTYGAPVPPVM